MYTKYEVSMYNPVPGEVCTDNANDNANDDDTNANANDDGQSMIMWGSLVDKPNEPETSRLIL